MTFLILILVKILSPIGFLVVFATSFISKSKWIIPVSAIIGAVTTETLITSQQITRVWGEGIFPGIFASLIHAVLSYWIINKLIKKDRRVSISDKETGKQ